MNKTKCVEMHLIKYGHITSWEAINEYGATRLSDIIYRLRNKGMNILNKREKFTDRFGTRSHYDIYIYDDSSKESF